MGPEKPRNKAKFKFSSDPILRIKKVNQKTADLCEHMNVKLMQILDRCDIDRPILMHDKLDYVWTEKKVPFDQLKVNLKLKQCKK